MLYCDIFELDIEEDIDSVIEPTILMDPPLLTTSCKEFENSELFCEIMTSLDDFRGTALDCNFDI